MKLSSSSEIIRKKLVPIQEIVKGAYRYWAHIDGIEKTETITEHNSLVINYLEKIVKAQQIDITIDNLVREISNNRTELAGFIKLLFISSIAYHDLGKINPNFQTLKMKNPEFEKDALVIESQHSVLSAYLFLHYFAEKINNSKFDKDERILLFAITHLLCYPIAKHHNPFISNNINFSTELFEELFKFLDKCGIRLSFKMSTTILSQKEKWINALTEEKQFALFSLLKLTYSLLTACDYYATNEYMAGMKVDEFGILNKELKKKIATNFKSLKNYNSDLFARLNEFANKPFSELQQKCNQNLNFLRQKLTAEVIINLRANPDNPWYYIEAPTGAGKTNLSLACISELLQTDQSLNKVFYVFPFTTLITQTFQGIQETIGLNSDELIQLHSKAGFHTKEAEMDGAYGSEKRLYLDNLFVNYPFCITSHVRFFEILKGNSKEANYMLHRLCNSIVVIDELQTYNPKHWSKIIFFIENYARLFNMRFIIMSATLPKIDVLSETAKGKFKSLTPNKRQYFTNDNFAGRVEFDFSLLDDKNLLRYKQKKEKEKYLIYLADFMEGEAHIYLNKHGKSRILIEFITKNTASLFFRLINDKNRFSDYKTFILSGDILEPQRKTVIKDIKTEKHDKAIIVSTQVVEAGLDIDMDIGFKDRSLLDSDEQLAGRINRNASKQDCKVFLFDCDSAKTIYGRDERYKQQQKDKEIYYGFKDILKEKSFDILYQKVFEEAINEDCTDRGKMSAYLQNFKQFDFYRISSDFKLIEDNDSEQIFIPLEINDNGEFEKDLLQEYGVLCEEGNKISGEKLFDKYISIITNKEDDFIRKQIDLKKLAGLMSQFTLSVYSKVIKELRDKSDKEKSVFGYLYLSHWEKCYSLESGFDFEKAEQDIIL